MMENTFSHPQRQSAIGVVVMFADTLQVTIRSLWPILIVWVIKLDKINSLALWLGTGASFFLISLIAYLKYRNFTFYLDNDNEEFIVSKGIWNKSRITISLDKIQQVNINQSLVQKIIGVHALEIDTAGSSTKEVSIRAINHDIAVALKERLLDKEDRDILEQEVFNGEAEYEEPQSEFIHISLISLFKTGITSNYTRSFALLLAFIITMFQYIEDFVNAAGYDEDPLDEYINPDVLLRFITFIIAGIIIVTILVNLIRTIVRFYDYKITRQKDSLLLSFGLINTKNTILRPNKVQILTIGSNFFQKKFNLYDLRIRQASGIDTNSADQKKMAIEIPGCDNAERDALLKFIFGSIPERGIALKPSLRKLLMQTFGFIGIPLAIYAFTAYFFDAVREYALFMPVYVLLASLVIYFGFRNNRLFVNKDFIIKQSGAWDIDNDIILPHKIQTLSVTQYFWHKGSDIGIVTLHTAGGSLSFGLANFTRLKQMVNYWLYQVETGNKNWI